MIGTGKGQMIDVSLWESLYSMLGPNVLVNQLTGAPPMRTGNRTTTGPDDRRQPVGKPLFDARPERAGEPADRRAADAHR